MLSKLEVKLLEKYCQELHFNNEALAVMLAVLLAKVKPQEREEALERAKKYETESLKIDKIDNFIKELRGLLERYNASIECEVHGDTHGLSYKMVVSFCREDRWRDYKLSDSNYISFQSIDWNDM